MNGAKHKRKEEQEDANRRYNERCGRDYIPKGIRKIANPLGIRKKEPTRLFEKLWYELKLKLRGQLLYFNFRFAFVVTGRPVVRS